MISLIFFIVYALFSVTVATDTLKPKQSISGNQTLISSASSFALGFFSPPNSSNLYLGIWYHNIPLKTVAWIANRDSPVTDLTATLTLTSNGTLTITNSAGSSLWSSSDSITSPILGNPTAQLRDNGNLVITDSSGSIAWQSFDHPTDTLMAGMKIGVDHGRNLTTTITSWKSASDPSTGDYTIAFDFTGDPEMYLFDASSGGTKIWRTGPWDGLQFSGIPDTATYQNFTFSYISDDLEISYSYVTNPAIISRLVVNYTGVVQRSVWIDDGDWNYFWYAPRDQCDGYRACGPYGVCDPNNSPICDCIQGFTPTYPSNWALRDGSGGCVRKTALDCRNGTDGFATVVGAKLPDTTNCTVDRGISLDACRLKCLSSCLCTGYAAANVSGGGGGGGCVIWEGEMVDVRVYTDAGQDLYVRLAAADLVPTTSPTHKSRRPIAAIVVSILLAALVLTGAAYYLRKRKRKRRGFLTTTSLIDHYNDQSSRGNEHELPLFDMETIVAATGNFSFGNKLGEGGFGPVYKGILGDDQEIAVKRLGKTSIQGLDEFKNEVVLIAKLQHRNLVRLLGCCTQGAERMLIYEYMPNRSLDAFLFDKTRAMLLDWKTRYNIISGIARGLLYLHQDSRLRIIHRDLKASNILLDKEMIPKISDFGMARIFGGDETEANTRRIVGTYGYMSPEYAMDGIFSVKSDVFSFGVLVLEIISGKKNRGAYHTFPHVNLLGHAWSIWNDGNGLQLLDESIGRSFDTNEVLKCMNIGLLCVQEHPEDRPLMSNVVLLLASENVSLPHPKQPGFALRRFPFETESSSSKNESSSHNGMSFTMFEGR